MYDHFRPPEHFTFWQGVGFRLLCLVTFIAAMVIFALYVLPWLGSHYFDPFTDWTSARFAAFFKGHEIIGGVVFFAIIGAPWAASHLYARHLGKRKREREASGGAPQ
jgi:hypothetical protein